MRAFHIRPLPGAFRLPEGFMTETTVPRMSPVVHCSVPLTFPSPIRITLSSLTDMTLCIMNLSPILASTMSPGATVSFFLRATLSTSPRMNGCMLDPFGVMTTSRPSASISEMLSRIMSFDSTRLFIYV